MSPDLVAEARKQASEVWVAAWWAFVPHSQRDVSGQAIRWYWDRLAEYTGYRFSDNSYSPADL